MKIIKATDLNKLLDGGEVTLIDVREPIEHKSQCIEGSYLIPLNEISVEKIPGKSKKIVIHCSKGKRSETACKKLLNEDPTLDVYSLEGGISAWEEEGFKVEKSATKVLPLDRQVQLSIGLLVFLGTILGFLVSPVFYIIPGLIGLGLISAGITGWCGMAKLIAKMPWNK